MSYVCNSKPFFNVLNIAILIDFDFWIETMTVDECVEKEKAREGQLLIIKIIIMNVLCVSKIIVDFTFVHICRFCKPNYEDLTLPP